MEKGLTKDSWLTAGPSSEILPHDKNLCAIPGRLLDECCLSISRTGVPGNGDASFSSEASSRHSNPSDSPLFLAGVNAPRQMVLAGSDDALKTAGEQSRLAGATRVTRLQVGVSSHCELLQKEAARLAHAMAAIELSPPEAFYIDNRGGRELGSVKSICEDLATNMAHTVRWHDGTGVMHERGVRLFVELPPGRVLTALVAAALPDVRAVACSDTRIDSVCALIRREAERG